MQDPAEAGARWRAAWSVRDSVHPAGLSATASELQTHTPHTSRPGRPAAGWPPGTLLVAPGSPAAGPPGRTET